MFFICLDISVYGCIWLYMVGYIIWSLGYVGAYFAINGGFRAPVSVLRGLAV